MRNAIANAIGIGMKGVSSGNAAVINTVTPVTVKGGVVRVIDSATGDIAVTNNAWIEDEKYGWALVRDVANVSAEFDTAVTRTGTKTLKFSNTDTSGRCHVDTASAAASTISVGNSKYLIPIKSSTQYRLNFYYKTANKTSGTISSAMTYNSSLARLTQFAGPNVAGTNDWTLATTTFTSDATATGLVIRFQNGAGAVEDTWIDVNSMTLEEVSSITNSGTFPTLYYPKATAVTTTDNIDQSQVVADNTSKLGDGTANWIGQQFTPTKKNLTGLIIRHGTETGTYTGNVTISVQADSAGSPSGTDLGTPVTISNANWIAITANTDYTVTYPLTLTIGGTYWIVIKSSTVDASNYTRIYTSTTDVYSRGVYKFYTASWSSVVTKDIYFKTLYSKNTDNFTVATDTQTLSVTAPTVDGWANGTIIDTSDGTYGVTPLTLAVGANNVYYSSNGPATADGTVDASLQSTISGTYIT